MNVGARKDSVKPDTVNMSRTQGRGHAKSEYGRNGRSTHRRESPISTDLLLWYY